MKTIRYNAFETNSSSCHSLTLCNEAVIYYENIVSLEELYKKFKPNETSLEDFRLDCKEAIKYINDKKLYRLCDDDTAEYFGVSKKFLPLWPLF